MVSIEALLEELEERMIAKKVGIPNDNARISFALKKNTVDDFDEFSRIIGDYYAHHFTKCVSRGGGLSKSEASGRAKEILEREYRDRHRGDLVTAFNDAHDGTNGGLRVILDIIAENSKAESVERYIRDVFDRHVTPNSWDKKVEIVRQFINKTSVDIGSSINKNQPERYAQNYQELIRSYLNGLQRTSSIFRRL
jgi:hypothetical protein